MELNYKTRPISVQKLGIFSACGVESTHGREQFV